MRDTSIEALASIEDQIPKLEREIATLVRNHPEGLTRDGIAEHSGILIQTVCGRVLALQDRGVLVETEERRQTRSGRRAIVLKAVEKGEVIQ
jgi:hypothetical protein